MPRRSTARDRLIETAATLFRRHGYGGVGLARVIAESGAPRGSIYHHFPGGKAELARSAAQWAGTRMLDIIDAAYEPASNPTEGRARLAEKVARLFEAGDHTEGCPAAAYLMATDAPEDPSFAVRAIYESWCERIATHAVRLGSDEDEARHDARTLLITLQGAWVVARAERSADAIRSIA